MDTDGKQLVAVDDTRNAVALGSGGSELIITRRNDGVTLTKMLGSREYLRYYRQKPRPTPVHSAIIAALASRYVHGTLFTSYIIKKNIAVSPTTTTHLVSLCIGFGG